MLPRPRVRLPLWAALALPAAAYVVRSVARGFDFAPDLPIDAIVLALLAVVVGAAAWIRRGNDRHEAEHESKDPAP